MTKPTGTDYAAVMRLYAKHSQGKIPQADAQRAFDRFTELAAIGTDSDSIAWDLVRRFPAIVGEKPLDNRGLPLSPSDYYTIHAHMPGGGLFRLSAHVLGKDVASEKRQLAQLAEEGTRLRYEIIWEGARERTVGMAGNAKIVNMPDVRPSPVPRRGRGSW